MISSSNGLASGKFSGQAVAPVEEFDRALLEGVEVLAELARSSCVE
jgi:hypothetical protein